LYLYCSGHFITPPSRELQRLNTYIARANLNHSDYAAKVFGFASFGRIYGTVVCVSGFTNFAQPGIDALVFGPLHGNPVPVNLGLGAGGALVGLALTTYVAIKGRAFTEEKVQVEAEERQRLMSVSEAGGYGTNA
jgi:hypothetical protein